MNWTIIPEQPILSMMLLIAVGVLFMYTARTAAHKAVRRLARLISDALRLQSHALMSVATRVRERNRDVLLEIGKAQQERRLERDFHRLRVVVERDLAQFPDLQHTIGQHISQLEEDYHRTAETPPPAPDWLNAIESVVRLRETQNGNPVVSSVLKDLETNLHRQHRRSLADYRKGMAHRHRLLHGMMPQWRRLNHALERVSVGIRDVLVQADEIDKHLTRYREIQAGSERAERLLRVSSLTHFVLSSIVLAAFFAIAWLNFQLIRLPLTETLATNEGVRGFALADLAAATIVGVEMILGMLLLEVLQITRLFEGFAALDARRRRGLFWCVLGLLAIFALAQTGLLYWREQDFSAGGPLQRLIAYPVIIFEAPALDEWLPIGARMLMGLVLPFVLVFTAAPLERWMETVRILLAEGLVQVLALVGMVLRIVAGAVRNLAELVVAFYDILISLPLWLELKWVRRKQLRERSDVRSAGDGLSSSGDNKTEMTVNSR